MRTMFTPLKIAGMEVKNRTFMAPMSLGYESQDGTVNEKMEAYWLRRAQGGVGCIIVDATSVDPNVPYLGNTLCFRDEESIKKYKSFTDKVHSYGCKIIPQITHPGPESISAFFGVAPVASSSYPNSMGQMTRELAKEELPGIVALYAKASKNAKEAGFDGIELWAQQFFARGYDTQEYLRLQALYPLRTCVHSCSWDLNLASMNQGIREMSIKQVEASMRLAAELEAMELTVHPGHMTLPGRREESMKLLQDSLEQIGRLSDRIGVDVSLEIMEKIPKEFVTDAQSMEEAAGSRKKQFFYTLDIAHCDSEEEPFHILDQMKRISKIHISNRKGKCYHTPLENGDFSFKEMLPQLLAYGLPLVTEGYDDSRDAKH